MTAHVTLPNPYKIPGYGITDFTTSDIKVGKIFRVLSDQGNVLERQVVKINQGSLLLLKLEEQDTTEVTIDAFVKVMRGRGIEV